MVKIFENNKIIDPDDGKSYSIYSTHGRTVLKKYLKTYKKLKKTTWWYITPSRSY